jgi:D-glycerate 3-kinase
MPASAYKLAWPQKMLEQLGGALVSANERDYVKVKERCRFLLLEDEILHGLYQIYLQIAAWLLVSNKLNGKRPGFLGINGAQGTGKSTAAFILKQVLECCFGKKVCVFSMDDLYLTRKQRASLARNTHPLLVTRGVPGTHDIQMGMEIFSSLRNAGENTVTRIPSFDKANDDRRKEEHWQLFTGKPDLVLLEGWCVSALPQSDEDLNRAVNEMERLNDHDGVWRRFVNSQLKGYQVLFNQMDFLIMLKAPGFTQIYKWRLLQEQKLRQEIEAHKRTSRGVMDAQQIEQFVQHFERLTRWMLKEMPNRADLVLVINEAHRIKEIILNQDG